MGYGSTSVIEFLSITVLASLELLLLYPSTPLFGFKDLPVETGLPSLSGSGEELLASGSIVTVSGVSNGALAAPPEVFAGLGADVEFCPGWLDD